MQLAAPSLSMLVAVRQTSLMKSLLPMHDCKSEARAKVGNAMFTHPTIWVPPQIQNSVPIFPVCASVTALISSIQYRPGTPVVPPCRHPGHLLGHLPKHGYDCHRWSTRTP